MNGGSRTRERGGIGETFRRLSANIFGDDFAEELQPMQPSSSTPSGSMFSDRTGMTDPNHAQPAHIHIRSRPEHQAAAQQSVPRPAALSPDQLQHSMKQLMQQKDLWALFKEHLAMEESPNNPETVRRVLIQFLEQHGHKISTRNIQAPPVRPVNSVFQGLNLGLDEESTHGVRQSQQSKAPSFERMSPEELQGEMMQLMQQPELWAQYKVLLSRQENPSDPDTIRRLLIEFLKAQRGDEETEASGLSSFFKSIQTSLEGVSQHRPWEGMMKTSKPKEEDMHTKLRLLRNAPKLYEKYQERLLSDEAEEDTPAADLLTKFMDEHKEELKQLGILEEEARRQEAFEGSLMDLEFATLAEEQSTTSFHRRHYHTPDGAGAQRLITQDRRQQFMAYRESVSAQSVRGIQNIVGAVGTFLGEFGNESSNTIRTSPREDSSVPVASGANDTVQSSKASSTQSHPFMQQDRRQQFMAYRDTLSSRSIRTVQNAVGALAGEIEEEEFPPIQRPPTQQRKMANESSQTVQPRSRTDGVLRVWDDDPQEPNIKASSALEGSFREGWRSVVGFVQHEMINMSTELETEKEATRIPYTSPEIVAETDEREESEEDLIIQQALEIALRHRSTYNRPSTLTTISDTTEDDGTERSSMSSVSGHIANALKDPMMDVTDHPQEGMQEAAQGSERTNTGLGTDLDGSADEICSVVEKKEAAVENENNECLADDSSIQSTGDDKNCSEGAEIHSDLERKTNQKGKQVGTESETADGLEIEAVVKSADENQCPSEEGEARAVRYPGEDEIATKEATAVEVKDTEEDSSQMNGEGDEGIDSEVKDDDSLL